MPLSPVAPPPDTCRPPPHLTFYPALCLLCVPQGVGKTTACGKLAMFLKKRRKKVLLVATDIYRCAGGGVGGGG